MFPLILCFIALVPILFLAGCVRAVRGKGKGLFILGSVLMIFLLAAFGGFIYKAEYQPHEIAVYVSDDQAHRLVVEQLGDPEFPFGDTKCRVMLTDGDRKINAAEVLVANDGTDARPDNFTVSWGGNYVSVVARGDESLGPAAITLPFGAAR